MRQPPPTRAPARRSPLPALALFSLALLGLAACGLSTRPYLLVRSFSLEIPPTAGASPALSAQKPRGVVLVSPIPPPATYESKKLVYRLSANEYTQDYYSEFYTPPARAVADSLTEAFNAAGLPYLFTRSQGVKAPDYALEIFLAEFHGDLRAPGEIRATVAMTVAFNDLRAANPRLLFTRKYARSLWVAPRTAGDIPPDLVVGGLVEALRQIAGDTLVDAREALRVRS
ncbi:MAG: PqiC family protein [Deltaproteobacteria bacterium]|jgi:ABC-type uncharacterized transport system auxiliary subunit|nr:PqiC family protein [Deltaproteobacteria bacterium]